MTILSILITLGLLVLVITIITRPLYSTNIDEQNNTETKAANLHAEYKQILSRIHELEQELIDGKIDQLDYGTNRERLNQEAAKILETLWQVKQPQADNQEK